MKPDKRRHPRKFVPPPSSPEQLQGLSYVANISLGGAFIKTNQLRPVGATLGITIKLPLKHSPPIRANGIVRWVVHYPPSSPWKGGMGIEFKEISPKSLQWIQRYIQHLEKKLPKKSLRKPVQARLILHHDTTPFLPTLLEPSGLFLQWNPLEIPPKIHRQIAKEPEVLVEIQLPEDRCTLRGKILWENQNIPDSVREIIPEGIVIQFLSPYSEEHKKILQFLKAKK